MMARRTRRISSSLFPLNITPAMTSIQPPAWWNGPLGPLTSGRDLYVVGLLCPADPVHAERPGDRAEAQSEEFRKSGDRSARLSGGHLADGHLARLRARLRARFAAAGLSIDHPSAGRHQPVAVSPEARGWLRLPVVWPALAREGSGPRRRARSRRIL